MRHSLHPWFPTGGDKATSKGHEMTTALKKLVLVVFAGQGLAPTYRYPLTTRRMGIYTTVFRTCNFRSKTKRKDENVEPVFR